MAAISRNDVRELGGKGAMLTALRDELPQLPIPEFIIKPVGGSMPNIPFDGSYMVRSSSPHEDGIESIIEGKKLASFAGLFQSEKVTDKEDIKYAINRIEGLASSDDIKQYAKNHGVDLTNNIATIIQKYSSNWFNGTITRHPGDEDTLLIYVTSAKGVAKMTSSMIYSERMSKLLPIDNMIYPEVKSLKSEIKEVIEWYKLMEHSSVLRPEFSYQVEFNLNPVAILQARPFRRKESADFELPKIDAEIPHARTGIAFGVTPEEGVSLPVIRSFDAGDAAYLCKDALYGKMGEAHPAIYYNPSLALPIETLKSINRRICSIGESAEIIRHYLCAQRDYDIGAPYCFAIDKLRNSGPLDLELTNMHTFVDFERYGIMTHDGFRMLQDTKVGLLFDRIGPYKIYKQPIWEINNFSQVRVYSNGRSGRLVQEKFFDQEEGVKNREEFNALRQSQRNR